jgi:hypothetical protein
MHCPKCGHEQASPEQKFCSKCGFETALVRELLTGEPGAEGEPDTPPTFWIRKNGIFISFAIIMLSLLAAVIMKQTEARSMADIIAMLGMAIGMICFIGSSFYLPVRAGAKSKSKLGQAPTSAGNPKELSEQTSMPVDDYIQPGIWKAPDTGQFAEPLSVTDNTTKLLEKNR